MRSCKAEKRATGSDNQSQIQLVPPAYSHLHTPSTIRALSFLQPEVPTLGEQYSLGNYKINGLPPPQVKVKVQGPVHIIVPIVPLVGSEQADPDMGMALLSDAQYCSYGVLWYGTLLETREHGSHCKPPKPFSSATVDVRLCQASSAVLLEGRHPDVTFSECHF